MAWYDDKNRMTYVAEYKDAKSIDDDAKRAGAKGWTIVSTTAEDGKVRVMGTMAKGALTGGVGLLMFGRSRKHGKTVVSWQRNVSAPTPIPLAPRPVPSVMPPPPRMQPPPPAAPPAMIPRNRTAPQMRAAIAEFAALRDAGDITPAEYEAARADILAGRR